MVTEAEFKSIFDYSSAFKYDSIIGKSNPLKSTYKSAYSYSISIPEYEEKEEKREHWTSMLLRHIIVYLLYVIVVCSFPISAWICIKKIHSLERLVLMRLGKLQPVRGPGFAIILPFVDVWTKVNLRPQIFTVSSSQMLTADGGIVEAKSDIEYQIANAVNYVMKLRKQEQTLRNLALHCLTNIVSERDVDDLEYKRDFISATLKEEMNHSVIQWGLEVTSIHIHPVKVLKAAEPVDALGTLMNTLKAVSCQSDQHVAAVFPSMSEPIPKSTQLENSLENKYQEPDVVKSLISLLRSAENKGFFKDVCANFKLEIIGSSASVIYCCCSNGKVSILQDGTDVNLNVSIMMTEDNLRAFLNKEISPFDAYMEGGVLVTGDWSLLRPLAKIFE